MQKRKLGKSKLEVPAIGHGCMSMSGGYGLRDIDSAASKITGQGARYPEELERLTYRRVDSSGRRMPRVVITLLKADQFVVV